MDVSILDRFRLTALEKGLHLYGVHVYSAEQGETCHFWRTDDLVHLYSGSKAFVALGVGMCLDEGRLSLDDRLLDFFPEYREEAAPGTEAITLKHLLHMASGKPAEEPRPFCRDDWAKLFLNRPLTHAPGSFFEYDNLCTYMLGRVMEKVSGEQTARDYLIPRLFTPLGIWNPQWMTCPGGHTLCGTGLFLHLEEYSRLGRLLLQKGRWEGRPLVSERFVDDLASDTIDNYFPFNDPEITQGYGYQVWRCTQPGSYRADGMYGQFCIVAPDHGAVVTTTAHEFHAVYEIIRAAFDDIINPYL